MAASPALPSNPSSSQAAQPGAAADEGLDLSSLSLEPGHLHSLPPPRPDVESLLPQHLPAPRDQACHIEVLEYELSVAHLLAIPHFQAWYLHRSFPTARDFKFKFDFYHKIAAYLQRRWYDEQGWQPPYPDLSFPLPGEVDVFVVLPTPPEWITD